MRERASFVANEGTRAKDLARALCELSNKVYFGGVPNISLSEFRSFIQEGRRIVMLRKHWVITDGIAADGSVRVRDPEAAPNDGTKGVEGSLEWDRFVSLLKEGQYQAVWRKK